MYYASSSPPLQSHFGQWEAIIWLMFHGILPSPHPNLFFSIYILFFFPFSNRFLYDFYHYFYMLTNILFYVSSAINPVLYNLVSANFRQIFLSTLMCVCLPWRKKKKRTKFNRKSNSISSNHTFSSQVTRETTYWLEHFQVMLTQFKTTLELVKRIGQFLSMASKFIIAWMCFAGCHTVERVHVRSTG